MPDIDPASIFIPAQVSMKTGPNLRPAPGQASPRDDVDL